MGNDIAGKTYRERRCNKRDAYPEERMDEVDIGWNWDADAKQNQGASCDDGDYKATDFGGNPQRTHGGRIRERLKGERSSRKQKEGLPALSPRASNAPLEDAENQLPAGPAGTAT